MDDRPASPLAPEVNSSQQLDLSHLPPVYLFATHLETERLHELEEKLLETHAPLTYDLNEAQIVLSKVTKKIRLKLDFKSQGVWIKEVENTVCIPTGDAGPLNPDRKRKRSVTPEDQGQPSLTINDEDSSTPAAPEAQPVRQTDSVPDPEASIGCPDASAVVSVLRLDWLEHTLQRGRVQRLEDYLTLQAYRVSKPGNGSPTSFIDLQTPLPTQEAGDAIIERAREDQTSAAPSQFLLGRRRFHSRSKTSTRLRWGGDRGSPPSKLVHLRHTTTSGDEDGDASDLPEMPDWVKQGVKYACQRSTPPNSLNRDFVGLLEEIRLARELSDDEIGVRAYSTSIASLLAYPYKLSSVREVLALPGCDVKIANLFVEWMNTGKIEVVNDLRADPELQVLRIFYNIWGVGPTTAREFFYDRGWHDLDDLVEHGWTTLPRVQQIGVKYYDEFLDPIPRREVEEIGRIIHEHSVKVRDERIQSIIVGGYRRGKEACGDVDIIVSHPDEEQTSGLITDIVSSLEDAGWITHTLLLSLNNTSRDQKTLPFRAGGGGHGFDSLDKALLVWQDPTWHHSEHDDPDAKNPNIHRRVDIIISPWRTVGCATVGWSGGTTFQRDIRRYVKNEKRWKFDSSGIRSRVNGEVIDAEGWGHYTGQIGVGRATTMVQAERRVFEAMGLVYREPWERCTG